MLATSLSPSRKMGLDRPSSVSSGRNEDTPVPTAVGLRASAKLDRQEQLQRRAPVAQRVEQLARDEEDAAPLLGDELDEVLHLRVAEEAGVGVAEDHDVVAEQLVLRRREGRQGGAVLLAVLGVRGEEHDVQVDRLVAFEVVLQVAELVAGLAVDVEDLELLLADRDDPLDPVVVGLELAGLGLDLDDEGPLAGRLGPVDQLDALGLAVGGRVDLLGLEVACPPSGRPSRRRAP